MQGAWRATDGPGPGSHRREGGRVYRKGCEQGGGAQTQPWFCCTLCGTCTAPTHCSPFSTAPALPPAPPKPAVALPPALSAPCRALPRQARARPSPPPACRPRPPAGCARSGSSPPCSTSWRAPRCLRQGKCGAVRCSAQGGQESTDADASMMDMKATCSPPCSTSWRAATLPVYRGAVHCGCPTGGQGGGGGQGRTSSIPCCQLVVAPTSGLAEQRAGALPRAFPRMERKCSGYAVRPRLLLVLGHPAASRAPTRCQACPTAPCPAPHAPGLSPFGTLKPIM